MKKFYNKTAVAAHTIILLIIAVSTVFFAYSTGITGVTQKPGSSPGCICHAPEQQPSVTVTIVGPDSVLPNSQNTYSITISGGPLVRAGTNIAASGGSLLNIGSDLQLMGDELTHTSPKAPVSGTVTFQFKYTAPGTLGSQTLYANGNSVNWNGGNDENDLWNFAPNKEITVVATLPVEMVSFTGAVSGNDINLKWSTATEINNKGFQLERMKSSEMEWKSVAFIQGKGNSSVVNNYSYTDKDLSEGNYSYRIKQIDLNGSFEYHIMSGLISVNPPSEFLLEQNYPNPFNPSTKISFNLPSAGNVSIKLYNAVGVETAVLLKEYKEPGKYNYDFNAKGLASGVYYYKMSVTSNDGKAIYQQTKKLMLLK